MHITALDLLRVPHYCWLYDLQTVQRTLNLEGKLNAQWSRTLGPLGRLHIQDRLQ